MSSILEIIARLLALTALFAWVNQRFLKHPNNVGILAMGLCASIVLVVLEVFIPLVDERPQILAATYAVILFTLIVQGLTLSAVVRRFAHPALKSEIG